MSEFGRRDSEDEAASGRSARRDAAPRGKSVGGPRGGARQDRGGRDGGYQGRPRRDDRGDRGGYQGNRAGGRDGGGSGGYQGNRSGGGGFNKDRGDRPSGGYQGNRDDRRSSGGYQGNRDDDRRSGGYQGNRSDDRRSSGGYQGNRDDDRRSGGYQGNRDDKRSGGGYQGNRDDKRSGGYQGNRDNDRRSSGGGYQGNRSSSDDRRGGYNKDNRSGGYQGNRDNDRPSYNKDRGDRPSYNRDDRPSYNKDRGDRPSYNRDDRPSYNKDRSDRPSYSKDRAERPSHNRDERPSYSKDRPSYNKDERPSYNKDRGDRPAYKDRDSKPRFERKDDRPSRGNRDEMRAKHSSRPPGPKDDAELARELLQAPELPEGIEFSDLDDEIRQDLRTLPKALAETVGKHLVAAGGLMDSDPEKALEHVKYAKAKASRVPVVREALGLVAYQAGNWSEALSELRAVRRMTRSDVHIAVIADSERAMGRPERALDLAKEVNADSLPKDVQVELRIVAAGARRDLGQLDAAVVALQTDDLVPSKRDPWSARLFYAYADNLEAAGRKEDALKWFLNAAEADEEDETDAAERAAELGSE
ncbi:hypothetical protein AB5J62_13960 [Amycolatopsis sp. cg5]|uniref:hypothetical protein n=1 Tax=Amycolatopsis sp. cg5 TaxID=3238802 RepID=UPI0035260D0E